LDARLAQGVLDHRAQAFALRARERLHVAREGRGQGDGFLDDITHVRLDDP
jgi:hypothetical protein